MCRNLRTYTNHTSDLTMDGVGHVSEKVLEVLNGSNLWSIRRYTDLRYKLQTGDGKQAQVLSNVS